MQDIQHFVNGAFKPGLTARFSDVFDPNTGEVQARVNMATAEDLDAAVAAAGAAQPLWARCQSPAAG